MQRPKMPDVETFIAWEERQSRRYEFSNGEVSLLPGAAVRHEIMVMNVGILLGNVLGLGRVRGSSLKVVTNTSSRYPDLSVSFDDRELPDATSTRYPTLLVEILSKSTSSVDRGPKSDEYRTIDTLEEYVTIDSRKRWAQTMRRSGEQWIVSLPITEGFLAFESVGAVLSFDELYAGTGL